jgi:general secretion pathway protein F
MPLFQYKAVSPAGEMQEGVLDAVSQDGVIAHLKTLGLIPIRAAEVSAQGAVQGAVQGASGTPTTSNGKAATWSLFSSQNVGQAELAIVTRELATLLKAGLPLDRSLEILINRSMK